MTNPNQSPIYPGAILSAVAKSAAVNALRDGTGTLVSLFAPATGNLGALITRVIVMNNTPIGSPSTAGVARLFKTVSAVVTLISEVALPSVTPTASVLGTTVVFPLTNIQLGPGDSLSVACSVADPTTFIAEGGSY